MHITSFVSVLSSPQASPPHNTKLAMRPLARKKGRKVIRGSTDCQERDGSENQGNTTTNGAGLVRESYFYQLTSFSRCFDAAILFVLVGLRAAPSRCCSEESPSWSSLARRRCNRALSSSRTWPSTRRRYANSSKRA